MKNLFTLLAQTLEAGKPVVLAVIISERGSSPRKTGALMLCGAEGRLCGTIGGGISEHLACEEAKTLIREERSASREYLLRPNDHADIGARCGGEVRVYLRYLNKKNADAAAFIAARNAYIQSAAALLFDIQEGSGGSAVLARPDNKGALCFEAGDEALLPPLNAVFQENSCLFEADGKAWFLMPVCSPGFVYICGGGHIGRELCSLLTRLDFRCVVLDDRAEFTQPELFPDALNVIHTSYDELAQHLTVSAYDYIIAVTSGHSGDYKTAAFALGTPARYIGIIGSKSKLAFVNERLRAVGFQARDITAPRVHAPIGFAIGSQTPAEVAVSIAAELIQVRAQ